MTKIDLSGKRADAMAQVANGQKFYTTAGQTQRTADNAQKPLTKASQACTEASCAVGIIDEINKAQDGVIAAGLDPAVFFSGFLASADRLIQAAKDDNLSAQEIADATCAASA